MMNALMFGVGAALLVAPLALAIQSENNLFVSVLRRVGLFGLIGLVGAGIQCVSHRPFTDDAALVDRALWFVQAVPVNAGGWLSHAIHERFIGRDPSSITAAPEAFIAIALGLVVLLSTFMTLHKDRSEVGLSAGNVLLTGLAIINMVLGASIVWWS